MKRGCAVVRLYEKGFARVRVGSPATVTTNAYPDLLLNENTAFGNDADGAAVP